MKKNIYTYKSKEINKLCNNHNELIDDNLNELFIRIGAINIPNNIDSFKELEEILLKKIPNLIIINQDTDTKEDIINKLIKVKTIYNKNMIPYFIDLSHKSTSIKKELKK